MSQSTTAPLLWVNKDASNVHSKKHVAEVNAHVQKSGSIRRASKPSQTSRKFAVPTRRVERTEKSLISSGGSTSSSVNDNGDNASDLRSVSTGLYTPQSQSGQFGNEGGTASPDSNLKALIFSSYLEEDAIPIVNGTRDSEDDFVHIERADLTWDPILLRSLDVSNPLPGFLGELSSHDRMLIHTHLNYMPNLFFGLGNHAVYCPVRTASVVSMLKAPIAVLWVLISQDMFMETARNGNTRKAAILRRKNRAYQLMSHAFKDQSQENDAAGLLGPAAAAVAEMFCGDPAKALTHLNGIDALIAARGGMDYIRELDLTLSMPIFAILAYRTLLQDNLTLRSAFTRAASTFIGTMTHMISWNSQIINGPSSSHHLSPQPNSHDEGFDGDFDLAEGMQELQLAREQAFLHHPILRKYVGPTFACDKPGDKIDHFIVLFNLNRAIADHGCNFRNAHTFINSLVDDVEKGGSSKTSDSTIKLSGVLRLLTNRQARMFPQQPSEGIVRAWEVLDALEIMKLLPSKIQDRICQSLHLLLIGRFGDAMGLDEVADLGPAISNEWQARHPNSSPLPG